MPTGSSRRGTAPIFFNRRMEINRDATILLLSLLKPSDYVDAMGATGVRGLRVANETGVPVTINDKDPEAIPLIQENVARLGLPVNVTCRDACSLLFDQSFDAVGPRSVRIAGTVYRCRDTGLPAFPPCHRNRYRTALRGTPPRRHPPVFCPPGKHDVPRRGWPAGTSCIYRT